MANVTLKSFQLPGLDNTYVVPQVDATLTQPGRPADAKKTGDEIDTINTALSSKASASDLTAEVEAREAADEALTEAIANKASADGSYEGMTVGSSEQLLSDSYTEDKVPYLFRASGGNGADREYDEIVGGTVAWNQLVQNGNFSDGETGWSHNNCSVAVANNEATLTVTSGTKSVSFGLQSAYAIKRTVGHKYFYGFSIYRNTTLSVNVNYNVDGNIYPSATVPANTYVRVETVISATTDTNRFFVYPWATVSQTYDGTESAKVKNYVCFDLTQMFGTTIADYIYSLETATAGAGVAFFRKLFPKEYYPYSAGELKSVEGVSAHEMVGFNQWDEVWELGNLQTNGAKGGSTDRIRSKNYIPILPNTAYYIEWPSSNTFTRICFYDENKAFISYSDAGAKAPFTTPSNAYYMLFNLSNYYGTTYKNDICINLSDPSKNGAYEPYVKYTYPLDDSLTLRGIPKLDSNNNLYFDGDTYEADGTVTRRYGVVDLGTLSWSYVSASGKIYAVLNSMARPGLLMCTAYPQSFASNAGGMPDKTIWNQGYAYNAKNIVVYDTAYTDAATFKTALSGVMLVYELTTPTTETAEPYEALQIVDPYGTEEYVSTGIVPVGHDTKYPDNLKAKIEGLPWNFATLIAPTEATYTATRNYTTGALFIVANVLYKATANIANGGTITPGTNCTATTLAEVISALA